VVPLCHSKVAARLVNLSLTATGRNPHKLHENQASRQSQLGKETLHSVSNRYPDSITNILEYSHMLDVAGCGEVTSVRENLPCCPPLELACLDRSNARNRPDTNNSARGRTGSLLLSSSATLARVPHHR
jgi:hypothetical protein